MQSGPESNPNIFGNGELWTGTQQFGAAVFLEHVAGEFALRNLSFLECWWINGTYLFNLKSSHSPHFLGCFERVVLKELNKLKITGLVVGMALQKVVGSESS